MTKRSVDFSKYDAPDDRVLAFMAANGIDPYLVPAESVATIEGGEITVTEFLLEQAVPGAPPHKSINSEGTGYKRTTRTVPLLSAPEDHGL